jgi:hypothetical protein
MEGFLYDEVSLLSGWGSQAEYVCMALESDAQGVFNLGTGPPCLLREFASSVRDCIDPALSLGLENFPIEKVR